MWFLQTAIATRVQDQLFILSPEERDALLQIEVQLTQLIDNPFTKEVISDNTQHSDTERATSPSIVRNPCFSPIYLSHMILEYAAA